MVSNYLSAFGGTKTLVADGSPSGILVQKLLALTVRSPPPLRRQKLHAEPQHDEQNKIAPHLTFILEGKGGSTPEFAVMDGPELTIQIPLTS